MDPTVIPIHTRVSGRARFKIKSLSPSLQVRRRVGAEVERLPGVRRATINPVTDSVLVFFDPGQDWREIAGGIAGVLEKAAEVPRAVESPAAEKEPPPAAFIPPRRIMPQWHQMTADSVLDLVGSSIDLGLDPATAGRRMRIQGENVVHETRLRSRAETLKDQFRFLPMALLLGESVAALLGGAAVEAAFLAAITAVNVAAGFLIDRRAEESLAAYKHRPRPTSLVLRGGSWVELPGEELVAGDILKLAPGTFVGADCRILEASHLKIDESILTGESNPADKHAGAVQGRPKPVFDQHNMAFMGTLVVGGEGVAVVVATGPMTEYGRLSRLFAETIPPQTPVVGKIHALSGTLLKTALAAGLGVHLFGVLRGQSLLRAAGRALSIAASAVPAGLPSAATVNMALGFRRLKHEQVSVRRLYSLESLSAVQMICFDKTGTLTRSRIDVQRIYSAGKDVRVARRAFRKAEKPFLPLEDKDVRRMLQACVLCSESGGAVEGETGRRFTGSPTETALWHLAVMAGLDPGDTRRRYPLRKVRHRGESRRYMATYHKAPGGRTMVFVKGNPSEVLDMCAFEQRGGRRVKLSQATRSAIEIENQRMAGEALRVLGFAYGVFKDPPGDPSLNGGLTWIGLVGMAEPVREGVAPLMNFLHEAGIQTVMVTGDQAATAEAVARSIGIGGGPKIRIFDSSRFEALTPDLAAALTRDVQVFVRIEPAQKLQIVKAFQHRGMVVAMTGDGINDSPALRAADVGIAMGLSGTDAAREVADMVLERDNITSVHTAIVEGRAAYRNLKRSLRYFIGTNFSDLLLTTAAATLSPGTDLLRFRPVQIDLLADLTPGLALLLEPARPDIGREPPRDREEPLFSSDDMRAMFTESAVLTGGALAAFGYALLRHGLGARAVTLGFESLSGAKALHALTCRPWAADSREGTPGPSNPLLHAAVAMTLTAQTAAMLVPSLRRLLNIAPLDLTDLAVAGAAAWATRLVNRRIRQIRRIESERLNRTG